MQLKKETVTRFKELHLTSDVVGSAGVVYPLHWKSSKNYLYEIIFTKKNQSTTFLSRNALILNFTITALHLTSSYELSSDTPYDFLSVLGAMLMWFR